ncbi:MAG: hypothetical protein GY711_31945 [bacterium]|nr:hypothetical protein [bacterium]
MRVMAQAAMALVFVTTALSPAQEKSKPMDADPANVVALRAAIEDLMAFFGDRYVGGDAFMAELLEVEASLASKTDRAAGLRALADLQRRALVANPLISDHPILYVERRQYPKDHHNTGNIFQTGEINTGKFEHMAGGALVTIDLATGKTETLVRSAGGTPRDPEVHFDAERIVFSMRSDLRDDYHVFEVGTDGSDLKQLTSLPGVSDLDPFYLASGDIAFSSTREPKYCTCNRHIMANLYRMEPDGANILQIGKSIEYEGHGIQLPDGRLLYFRWEYVDRNFGGGQGLWVSNPDGTNHAIYYGQSTPHAVINARPIPASDRLICILSSCHDRPWGALAILDRKLGIEGREPIVRIWPESARELIADASTNYSGSGGFDKFKRVPLKYEDPYALSDKHFLVSRVIDQGSEDTGIFLVDTFGNEVLLHRAAKGLGCYDPMPIGETPRPRRVPSRRDYGDDAGRFYVANVYQGTHMQDVEPGSIEYLRVVENPPKLTWTHPAWNGQGQEAPAMNWHDFDNKRILGTVPVEEDGSAYFAVPSDRFVYFQLLDAKQRMVQSMRSGVIAQSGEMNSCIGCHEDRDHTPEPARLSPLALERGAHELTGWLGAERDFGFMAEVQPVFTKNCVQCHDYGEEAGEVVNLAPDRTLVFNTAYMELHAKELINVVGGGPNRILEAYSWGSNASRLVEVLDEGHYGVELSEEDYQRVTTWIDLNAPYYPTYASAYDTGPAGRAPLSAAELETLQELTGKKVLLGHGARPMISFDRPELSPILAGLEQENPEAFEQALAIVASGKSRLAQKPRAGMPGFEPCETDRVRLLKYDRLRDHQLLVREALRNGEKVYDHDRVK